MFDGGENELATEMELNGKLNGMNGFGGMGFLIVAIMVDNISVLCLRIAIHLLNVFLCRAAMCSWFGLLTLCVCLSI